MLLAPRSTLALLVTRVRTDNDQPAVTPHDLAVLADALHAGSHLHDQPPGPSGKEKLKKL
jgi:hypothetical protein